MIYDAFTFFNEFDLLDLRLNILGPVVDKFIIVEASHTFQGWRKPWNFEEQSSRYKDFMDRIIYVKVEDLPIADMDAWHNEWHQRNAIMRGLSGARPNDMILTGDCDEIPDPNKIPRSGDGVFYHGLHYYYLNVTNGSAWPGTRFCLMKNLQSPQDLRYSSTKKAVTGGWHWSFVGSADWIANKIRSFAHSEYNTPDFAEEGKIEDRKRKLVDLFDRPEMTLHKVSIDDSYPQYLRDNLDKYKHLILE